MTSQRVIACVVQRDDRYLLCKRPTHKRHGGLWEFPGGKTEPDESDEDAARRELLEELGVRVVGCSTPLFEVADQGSPFVIAFVPVSIEGEPVCTEHDEYAWVTVEGMSELHLAPSDRSFANKLREQKLNARVSS